MSSAPKRLHEEGNHSTPLKRPLEDSSIFSSHGKLVQSSGNDFRVPFETMQDGRSTKVPRTELREADKRAPLLHRMTSPSNYLDHSVVAESRLELRNLKDSKDIKTESREAKAELKESYGESRIDRQSGKVDKEARFDNRDGKEIRSDRGPHSDFKSDKKIEKDSHAVEYSHLNWKDSKEHYKGKRSFEPVAADGLDSWRLARLGPQNTNEVSKNLATAEERTALEAHETVGENKVEMKGEEVYREKERKKHKDFGERDKDRSDRQKGMQVDGANECKEFLREERESERLKRERNYSQKDKEHTDKDKYPNRGESSNVNEKEKSHYDKELGDGSSRICVKETIALQPQQHRDDSCRAPDSDLKDRGRGMDTDAVDKNEKHDKCFDKESDDGCEDGSAVTEKNGQVYGNGLQQRKRMLRSRGASQSPHRETPVRSRARDNERSQGQYEVSAVAYKPGVCMQELLKSWREFEASQDTKNDEKFQNGPTLEIQIAAEFVTATNRQVRGAQLWGTDIYTHDSDLVAVLMHTGYCRPTASPLPAIHELRATVQVLPTQDCYASTLRNNVRSRAWGAGIGCSFRVERCYIVKKGGGTISLEPRLTHISAVEPTLAPVSVERTMTTRAAASNALRQQRFVREVTVQYNLCNEPWLKYSISIVADKGLKKPLYTATRLKKGEVLYLETHLNRYELCFSGEKAVSSVHTDQEKLQNHSSHVTNGDRNLTNRETVINVFRWSRCKRPLSQDSMRSIGIPLPIEHLEVLVENLDWEDVQWSQTGVWVAGKEYILARVHFLSQA